MKNRTKIILAVVLVVGVLCSVVVPTFALGYPSDIEGSLYYQPLREIGYYGNSNFFMYLDGNIPSSTVTITYDGSYDLDFIPVDDGQGMTRGIFVTQSAFDFDCTDVSLTFEDVQGNYTQANGASPYCDMYLVTDWTSDENDNTTLHLTYDFDLYHYVYNEDADRYELVTLNYSGTYSSPLPIEIWDFDDMRAVVNISDALNAVVNSIVSALPVVNGLDYIPYSISSMLVGFENTGDASEGWVFPNYGVVYYGDSQRDALYDYGLLSLPYLPFTNTGGTYEQGYQDGYNEGHQDGYNEGFDDGFEDGSTSGDGSFDEGYQSGYNVGYQQGVQYGTNVGYQQGLDEGYDNGYDVGLGEGITQGYSQGLSEGYADGFEDGEISGFNDGYHEGYNDGSLGGFSNVGEFLSRSIGAFLGTPIFGDITLGTVLLIPITVPIVLMFLKLFAGG